MKASHPAGRRFFVLDTNVLMHDPTAIFRFHEHDIFLPMTVLEELDAGHITLVRGERSRLADYASIVLSIL